MTRLELSIIWMGEGTNIRVLGKIFLSICCGPSHQ